MRTIRRRIPDGVASNVKQYAILARDCSGSMSGAKIGELDAASQALLQILADPVNRNGFVLSVIDFNEDASITVRNQLATEVQLPTAIAGGGALLHKAWVKFC